jgi:predicted ribosomally synthesized peptide with SipW-like signal peptide
MKIIKSTLVIALVLGAVGATTAAFFSDTGTSSANTFTAGTLVLKLNGADNATANWTLPNMAPGDSVSGSLMLTNTGTLAANHVEINPVTNSVTDAAPAAANAIDKYLQITAATYNGDNLLSSGDGGKNLNDSNGNGWIDLDDLESAVNAGEGGQLDNLAAPAPGGMDTKTLSMTVTFRTSAPDDLQGDSDTMSLSFTLNQDATQ